MEKTVWIQKQLRVYIQNVSVCTGTTRTCVSTCARGAGTHGDVLNVHGHTGRRGSSPVLLTRICPRMVITGFRGSPKKLFGSFPFSSLRIDWEQHVPDSSNHSLYLIKLFISSSPEGICGGNQPPDGSICLSPPRPNYNERFARPSTMFSCF